MVQLPFAVLYRPAKLVTVCVKPFGGVPAFASGANVPVNGGVPAANEVVYNRSISVGKNLFISTGSRKVSSGASPDITRNFYRVIMYHLTSDHDEYSDDKDNDTIREDDQ